MNYEQKYKEALERAKELKNHIEGIDLMSKIFPELKESEDEKIRKTIEKALKGKCCLSADETNRCLAWLEKQKPKWSDVDKAVIDDIVEAVEHYWHGDTQDIIINWIESLEEKMGE